MAGDLGVFSTAEADPSERKDLWRSVIGQHIGQFDVDFGDTSEFGGKIAYADLGKLQLCKILTTAHKAMRTQKLIDSDKRESLKLLLQISGNSSIEQRDNLVLLSSGDWSIYDTSRPYSINNISNSEQLLLQIPYSELKVGRIDMKQFVVRRFSSDGGIGHMACGFLTSTFAQFQSLHPSARDEIANMALHLIRLAIMENVDDTTGSSLQNVFRQRIQAFIDSRLGDPDLSIDVLASAFRCSKRYLHRVFGESGLTLDRYIWRSRLEKCRSDLVESAHSGRSITDIAFAWGFNSSAHFSRLFKNEYGISPSEYRGHRKSN